MSTLCRLTADLGAGDADAFSDLLLGGGALSTSVISPDLAREAGGDGRVTLTALFDDGTVAAAALAAAAAAIERPAPPFRVEPVDEGEDWVARSREVFAPVEAGGRLRVRATWHEPAGGDVIEVVVDPGQAFGTGAHPTTLLCLRWIDLAVAGGERVVDYGCGSGILAIAARLLGAGDVTGVDIDDTALQVARENAAANGAAARFLRPEEDAGPPADLLAANILLNPLVTLAPRLAALVRPGGRIALAGILAGQAAALRRAFEPWFDTREEDREGEWVLVTGVRREGNP